MSRLNLDFDTTKLRKKLSEFQRASRKRSSWQLINSFVPYVGLWVLAILLMKYSYWLALPAIIVASGFLIRLFIIFHDCGHYSFFRSRKTNNFWGLITGIITFTPYHYWRKNHALHHATSGNLDKRGFGDVWTMTMNEYIEAPAKERFKYRLYRNPFILLILGPLFIMLVSNRMARHNAGRKERISVYVTNLGIIAIAVILSLLIGPVAYLAIQLPILFIGLMMGIWLFYVQHQFEGVYWANDHEWDFVSASLYGSSYYRLPAILKWFTGNIGYHHIHHLNSRIPNYNLPKCSKAISILNEVKSVGLFASLKSIGYRLWDEDREKMVGFREIKRRRLERTAA